MRARLLDRMAASTKIVFSKTCNFMEKIMCWEIIRDPVDNWGEYYTKTIDGKKYIVMVSGDSGYYDQKTRHVFPFNLIPDRYGITDENDVLTILVGAQKSIPVLGPNVILVNNTEKVKTLRRVGEPFKFIEKRIKAYFKIYWFKRKEASDL